MTDERVASEEFTEHTVDDVQPSKSTEHVHELKFLYPGQGRHDVYQCVTCKAFVTKMWNETGTTTYKDRV